MSTRCADPPAPDDPSSSAASSAAVSRALDRAAAAVDGADALLVTAGAGMGVDSGLPDFRGTEGFWRAYPPLAERGVRFEEMASPSWFERDPALAWGFYGHRLGLYRETRPHRGFELLRAWGSRRPGGSFVYTSNVDGQFQRAGFPAGAVYECHGSIHHLQCVEPCCQGVWEADGLEVDVDETRIEAVGGTEALPQCRHCGDLARPNVLMFGDWRWVAERTATQRRRLEAWVASLGDARLVIVEIGAGTAVPTVRRAGEELARGRPATTLVRVNPRQPRGPADSISLPLRALEALEALEERLGALSGGDGDGGGSVVGP